MEKKEWEKPEIMDLGTEMTQHTWGGDGQDGGWVDADITDGPANILGS